MRIENNAIDIVLKAVNELYPCINSSIWFAPIEVDAEGYHPYGCTTFPHDGAEPIIEIGIHTPIEAVPEIMAHEVAHVVAGEKADHNKEWENVFNKLQEKYVEVIKRKLPNCVPLDGD